MKQRTFFHYLPTILFVLFSTLCYAQDAEKMLEMHAEWSKTHTPKSKDLNDEQLILECAKAINSSAREPELMDIIREAGHRFGIKGLNEYADGRERRIFDPDGRKERILITSLIDYSKKCYGLESSVTAKLYPWILGTLDKSEMDGTIIEFNTVAQSLNHKEPGAQSKELFLLARFYSLIGSKEYEDLSIFKDYLELIDEVVEFYSENNLNSDYRWIAYMVIWQYSNYIDFGNDYCALELSRSRLFKSGHGCYKYLVGETSKPAPSNLNIGDFFKASIAICKRMLHEQHPNVISLELLGYSYNLSTREYASDFSYQFRLKVICDFIKQYHGKESPILVDLHGLIRRSAKDRYIFDNDVWDYEADIDIARKYDDGAHWFLLNTLESIIFEKKNQGEQRFEYAEEYLKLLQLHHADDRLLWLSIKAGVCAPLQSIGMPGHETDIADAVDEYLRICLKDVSWKSVHVGKRLLDCMMCYVPDIPRCIVLANAVIVMEKELSGENPDIFACEYHSYGRLTSAFSPQLPLTLDGRQDIDALYDDIFEVCRGSCVPICATDLMAGSYYAQGPNPRRAITLLREAELHWDSENPIIKNRYSNKSSIYIVLMECYGSESINMPDSVEYYAQQLETEIGKDYFDDYAKFEGCCYLAKYLTNTHRVEKGLRIAQQCFDSYDRHGFPKQDNIYMNLVSILIDINGNINSDMDKCQRIMEKINSDLLQNNLLLNPYVYLKLMKTYYDLLEQKEPNNYLALIKVLSDMGNMYMNLPNSAQIDASTFCNYKLYIYYNLSKILSQKGQILQMAKGIGQYDIYLSDIQSLTKLIEENAIPEIEEFKEPVLQKYPSAYGFLLYSLGIAYNSVDNEDKAEYYLKESFRVEPHIENGEFLTMFYEAHHRHSEACEMCDTLKSIVETEPMSNGIGIGIENLTFRVYYNAKQYEKALKSAFSYKQLTTSYIKKNFDLFTENEREAFIGQYGAGGYPLFMMLPYNENIVDKVYDAVLEEKGLLLRSSERMERAIRMSGDTDLIQKLDSLYRLRTDFAGSQMQNFQDNLGNLKLLEKYQNLQRIEREVARKAKKYMLSTNEPKWQDVRKALTKTEAAIEFVVTDSLVMALVLKRDFSFPRLVKLFSLTDILGMEELLSNANQETIVNELYVKDKFQLYNILWKPIQDAIGDATTIYYSPTGFLNAISFAAIKADSSTCLIDKYDLRQLTTTGRLASRKDLRYTLRKDAKAKIYGALCYEDSQLADYNLCVEKAEVDVKSTKKGALDDFPFLVNTVSEVQQIEQILAADKIIVETKKMLEATEEEFRTMDGKSPEILHISTHGFFFSSVSNENNVGYVKRLAVRNPMTLSGLALSNALPAWYAWYSTPGSSSSDNILSSEEVASIDLHNTQLVFLSACQTGLGGIAYDGVFGVQRGFKKAGVNTMCVSLWSVNDDSTANLALRFYKNLTDGTGDFHQAFISAQKEQRNITPSPYDWASFVLIDAPFNIHGTQKNDHP